MNSTVGIIGGGQLARMLILAGAPLGLRFVVYDPSPDACAGQLAPLHIGAFDDIPALQAFARAVDYITFDFENVPAASIQALTAMQHAPVFPNPNALAIAQDRLLEKTLFQQLGMNVPLFADIKSLEQLQTAVAEFNGPCILKTRRLGYDGKGQFRINQPENVESAWQALGAQCEQTGLILESLVAFDYELSVIAVRNQEGELRIWPLSRNWHVDGVLSVSVAWNNSPIKKMALDYIQRLANHLDYVGVLALELFCCNEKLVVNEMAPRVHNSGHWTIEGAITSQFQNHLRAGLGLPLGATELRLPDSMPCMLNFIGTVPPVNEILAEPAMYLHDYGKTARPGRKVGHATILTNTASELSSALDTIATTLDIAQQVEPVLQLLTYK